MSRFLLVASLVAIQALRYCLYPLILTLGILVPSLRKRLHFESLNKKDEKSETFIKIGDCADYAFEVSSEGELEQVKPLILHYLNNGKKIELLYASESVEKKCQALSNNFENIRVFRMPLLTLGPSFLKGQSIKRFLTAPSLILCRYDFYPELLLYGIKGDVRFSLVSATLKGKTPSGISRLLLKLIYELFNNVVLASELDRKRFKKFEIGNYKKSYDFRVLQILERVRNANNLLTSKNVFKTYSDFVNKFEGIKIVFGSFWASESAVFDNDSFINDIKSKKALCVLAPHHIDDHTLKKIKNSISQYSDISVYDLNRNMNDNEVNSLFEKMRSEPGILVNRLPAILCESYTLYDHAFVGGGHGRSIHSVLEPYYGASHIYCGPKTHRSTEYDFVKNNSPHFIHIVEELKTLYNLVSDNSEMANMKDRLAHGKAIENNFSEMISLF